MNAPAANLGGMEETPGKRNWIRSIFYGKSEPRAGWRFLVFILLMMMLSVFQHAMFFWLVGQRIENFVLNIVISQVITFGSCLVVCLAMGWFEKRTIADYGLPTRQLFQGQFWQGMAMGFFGLTAVVMALYLCGAFKFEGIHLTGTWLMALAYATGFLCVGLSEEFLFRGYMQFTLTTGMSFWPAALVTSGFFALTHSKNPNETWIGVMNVGLSGLLMCLMLRKTGNLWMAIGYHAAWDWGESYFYGVANSGIEVPGHLIDSSISGPTWLSGGGVGPEGSVIATAGVIGLGVIVARFKAPPEPPPVTPPPLPETQTDACEQSP